MRVSYEDGFSFAECMVALLILTITGQFLFPVFTQVYAEHQALQQHERALTILHNTLIEWAFNDQSPPKTLVEEATTYALNWEASPQKATFCVTWTEPHGRQGKECGGMDK